MTSNYILRVAVLAIAAAVIYAAEITEFHMEEPCANAGGQCLKKDECSAEIPTQYIGLCPDQQDQGAECCHGVSTKEYRCQRLGGDCFPESSPCGKRVRIAQATDCESDEICCALV